MRIIGYTYDSNIHCPQCTLDFYNKKLKINYKESIPLDAVDHDYNLIRPVFDIDEAANELTDCRECGVEL
jgi:hypothetical protein